MDLQFKEYKLIASKGKEPNPCENTVWIDTSFHKPKWLMWTAYG